MPNLIRGRIVKLKTPRPDPQGQNPKPHRRYVVVNNDESIAKGEPLTLIGITSAIAGLDTEVKLDWANKGMRSWTKLIMPSVALCTWKETASQDEVEITDGFVQPKFLKQILQKLAEAGD